MSRLSHIADHICPPFARPVLDRVKGSPIARRLASGAFWSVVGVGIGKGATFITMLLVARLLGMQLYGELGFVLSATNMMIGFSSFGIGLTATTYIAAHLENNKPKVGRIIGLCYGFTLLMCLVAAVVVFAGATIVCDLPAFHYASHLTNDFRISIPAIIFMTFTVTQTGVLAGFQDFRSLAFSNIISGALYVPLCLFGTYQWGLTGTITGIGVASLTNVLVNSIFIHRCVRKHHVRYDFIHAWNEKSILLKQSLPIFLCSAIFCLTVGINRFMIASSTNGFCELGIFMAAIQIEPILYTLPTILASVILPVLSNMRGDNNMDGFNRLAKLSIQLNLAIALALALPIALFSGSIMEMFGKDFSIGGPVLATICFGVVFHAGVKITQAQSASLNRMWGGLGVVTLFCIIQFTLTYVFLSNGYGALGAALAYAISYAFYFIGMLFVCLTKKSK